MFGGDAMNIKRVEILIKTEEKMCDSCKTTITDFYCDTCGWVLENFDIFYEVDATLHLGFCSKKCAKEYFGMINEF
jgi:hypothetical protein